MKSMRSYIQRSILTILRIFITYKPLRFFLWLGAVPFAVGTVIGLRWLWLFWCRIATSRATPSLILAAILILIGVQMWGLGAVADVIAVNRKLLEDIQQRVKRIEYGNSSSSSSS